ncbi:MAG: hypothetical protein RIC18_17060 [Hoeflea sp.]|uniref:hypothetical protein n=1 Tax=Hoeflea sp. TaxID=1940281 RepID=UPI0032EAF266
MTDHTDSKTPDRRLSDIVRDVKISAADRTDVVVDMRDADRARLELLAQELEPVIADLDPSDDRFDFGLSTGLQPRLWVDAVAHVHMGHDRRVYRFVRDTRLGRKIISDTADMAATADAVARYIAERVIERERILAGDFEAMRERGEAGNGAPGMEQQDDADSPRPAETPAAAGQQARPGEPGSPDKARPETIAPRRESSGGGFALGVSWFILGCVAGAAALVGAFWDRLSALMS